MNNRTSVKYGDFIIKNRGAKTEANNRFSRFSDVLTVDLGSSIASDEKIVYQKEIPYMELLNSIHLTRKLGSGGNGTAFLASYIPLGSPSKPCVVKFSNIMIEANLFSQKNDTLQFTKPTTELQKIGYAQGIHVMKQEYMNATKILAPYYGRSHSIHNKFTLKTLDATLFRNLQREAKRIRNHPGFAHLHRILHFDEIIGCLISEYCNGSLLEKMKENQRLIERYAQNGNLTTEVLRSIENPFIKKLVYEIGLAIHYLLYIVQIGHMDIKEDNIFYKIDPTGRWIWKIGDFGLCEQVTNDVQSLERYVSTGTLVFSPLQLIEYKKDNKEVAYDARKCMIFSYAMTMVSALAFNYASLGLNFSFDVPMETFYVQEFLLFNDFELQTRFSRDFGFLKRIANQSLSYNSNYLSLDDKNLIRVFDESLHELHRR